MKYNIFLFLFGVFSTLLAFQSSKDALEHPSLGVQWSYMTGVIFQVNDGIELEIGNKIEKINGLCYECIRYFPQEIYANNTVKIKVYGKDTIEEVTPTKIIVSPTKLLPIVSTIIFLLTGWAVLFLATQRPAKSFALFSFCCGAMLSMFSARYLSYPRTTIFYLIYYILLLWLPPILLRLHFDFPIRFSQKNLRRSLLPITYIISVIGSLTAIYIPPKYLTFSCNELSPSNKLLLDRVNTLITSFSVYFAVGVIIIVALLIYQYKTANNGVKKRQIGVILLGILIGTLPFISFSMLPEQLIDRMIFSYEITYSFFAFIPLTYLLVIRSSNLMGLEQKITRHATLFILLNILSAGYLIIKSQIEEIWKGEGVELLLIALALFCFYPLRELLQTRLERILYGGYAPQEIMDEVLKKFSDSTAKTPYKLENMIQYTAVNIIRATSVTTLLSQPDNTYSTTSTVDETIFPTPTIIKQDSPLISYFRELSKAEPKDNKTILKKIKSQELTPQEYALLSPDRYRLFVPLHNENNLLGLIILGHKQGGGIFDYNDLTALNSISHLSSLILYTLQQNTQIEDLNEDLLRQYAKVRQEITSDLHNRVLSRLALLQAGLSSIKLIAPNSNQLETKVNELEDEIQKADSETRDLIAARYPQELDIGLKSVLSAWKGRYERTNDKPTIKLQFRGNENSLSKEVIHNLYRIAEGALHNAIEHADCDMIIVRVVIEQSHLELKVIDDGDGFDPSTASRDKHFGLEMMQAIAKMIGGNYKIESETGNGTTVSVKLNSDKFGQGEI